MCTFLATAEVVFVESVTHIYFLLCIPIDSTQAGRQIESLQQQLTAVTVQRERLTSQLAAAQEQASQYAAESNNLHLVLEQFQQGMRNVLLAACQIFSSQDDGLKDDRIILTMFNSLILSFLLLVVWYVTPRVHLSAFRARAAAGG